MTRSLFHHPRAIASVITLATGLSACGDLTSEEKKSPQPQVAGESESLFSLENGIYFVKEIESLDDGCQKNPLDPTDSLTQVEFNLENKGDGQITLDFCLYNGRGTQGSVLGNQGILTASHSQRQIGSESNRGIFDQRCSIKVNVIADNTIRGQYSEYQSNRNKALRQTNGDNAECTTRFDFTMRKKDTGTTKTF